MRQLVILTLSIIYGISAMSQAIIVDKIKNHVYTLASDSLMGRGFGTRGGRTAADYIERQLIEAGIQPWKGQYRHGFISGGMVKAEGQNLVGWIEGNDPNLKNEYIVVGAHYDHVAYRLRNGEMVVYNGADDNASGTAAVIELGRWLVQNKDKLKRSVILALFDGEESGLIGSSNLVRNNVIPIDMVKMMFSLDMVGMLSTYGGIDMKGNATLSGGKQLLNGLAQKHGISVKKQGRKLEQQTDTEPFGRAGIPSVHIFTSTVSPYHKPEDDAHLLDYEGIVTITNFMSDVVTTLATAEELKANRAFVAQAAGKGVSVSAGFNAGFGSASQEYMDDFFIGKQVFGANAGLFAKINFGSRFSLQPEVGYRTVGSEHNDGTLRTHEVVVPVNFRLRISPKGSLATPTLVILAGPYYSHRFHGKVGKNSMDFTNKFSNEEMGLQYGVSFEMMGYQVSFVSQLALSSIEKGNNVRQHYTTFTVGIPF